MSMWIKEKYFFMKYGLLKPGAMNFYSQLLKAQFLSEEEIEDISWKRTSKMLHYAYEHVPFYRKRFAKIGLRPEDISCSRYYSQVPCLTREDLLTAGKEMISEEASERDLTKSTTGGSTGIPVTVFHQNSIPRSTIGWRVLDWWGVSPADNWASAWRISNPSFKGKLMHLLQWWPTSHIILNASTFTVNDIQSFLKDFSRNKPSLLHGYVGAIDSLASFILEHDIELPSPKAVWTTSAPITEVQRQKIEKAFGAPVYDQYGCCEIYWLSAECRQRNGLHMFHDVRRIEFLDDHRQPVDNDHYGDIAITDLLNFYFPLIRYLNGDRGRRLAKSCNCGCHLPLMDKVKGRISDTFVLPSGTRINGEFLTTLFDEHPDAVKQFQLHQLPNRSIIIRIIPANGSDDLFESIRSKLAHSLSNEVSVTLEKVTEIPDINGKMRFIISECKDFKS